MFRVQCPSAKAGGGVAERPTAGEQHDERSSCAGFLADEGIPSSEVVSPFAGWGGSSVLGRIA